MKSILTSGPAVVIYTMFVVSLASSLFGEVTSSLGNGQHARMIKLASNFLCLASVVGTIGYAINKILGLFGM